MDSNTSTNITNVTSNQNNNTTFEYHWTFVPVTETLIFPCAIILNGVILVSFLRSKQLRIPFNIYLASVLASNIILAILNSPLDVLNFISPYWWLGDAWCTVYQYAINVSSGIVMYSHILITINRIWAVTFPHSYRQHHTQKNALILVVLIWVCVHAVTLPGVVMDAVLYRLPVEKNGCALNMTAMPFLIYAIPNGFIIVAYPFLLYKRLQRRKVAPCQLIKIQD
ncbi:alpha-2B adrenergic receptor-like [Paramacrobiotus metropolitanus]|uniref:alpha-2B adrenergic receptor-like n=1 Tax=Paramacrobiotus metropolitanus TaxID=2943436 RepID=UPI0024457DF7|nr:alpha-2B adrenergic receptor-like [Paramacrobiotus metropolitanus]